MTPYTCPVATAIPPRVAEQIAPAVQTFPGHWMALFQVDEMSPFWIEVAGPDPIIVKDNA